MKNFKLVVLVLAVVMVFGVVGCSSSNNGDATVAKMSLVLDDILKIIKVDASTPEVAAVAISKYVKVNGAKITVLQKQMAKLYNKTKGDADKRAAYDKQVNSISNKFNEIFTVSMKWQSNTNFRDAMKGITAIITGTTK